MMELSNLGGLRYLLVLIVSVVYPIFVYSNAATEPVPQWRISLLRICAICNVFPLPVLFCLDALGIPPDTSGWLPLLMVFVAMFTGLGLLWIKLRMGQWSVPVLFAAAATFCLLVTGEIAEPFALTLIPVYRQPVAVRPNDHRAATCDGSAGTPLFAHISDLHVTNYAMTRDGKTPGNDRLGPMLNSINLHHPPFLVISGDLTDQGQTDQWSKVRALLAPLDRNTKVFFSTGNHDLNHFFGADPVEHPWDWFGLSPLKGMDAEPRIFRAASFQEERLPSVMTNAGLSLKQAISDLPAKGNVDRFQKQLGECAARCVSQTSTPDEVKMAIWLCPSWCDSDTDALRYFYLRDFADLYPLSLYDSATHTAFFALTTSMGDSTASLRNAIGTNGADQVTDLKAELAKLSPDTLHIIIVQHHPPLWFGVPAFPRLSWKDAANPVAAFDKVYTSDWVLAVFLHNNFDEESRIYRMLSAELDKRPNTDALIAYGHRHQKSLRTAGRVILEESPNLATDEPDWQGYYLVGIKDGRLSPAWCKVGQ